MSRIKVGDKVYSDFFGREIEVVCIRSEMDWYFKLDDHILKAQTPLSYFEKVVS